MKYKFSVPSPDFLGVGSSNLFKLSCYNKEPSKYDNLNKKVDSHRILQRRDDPGWQCGGPGTQILSSATQLFCGATLKQPPTIIQGTTGVRPAVSVVGRVIIWV